MTGTLTPELAEKERKAVELRIAGYDYVEIAQQLGYADHTGALKAVRRALLRTMKPATETERALEVARMDRVLKGVWHWAERGQVESIDRVLKISKRRSELLGLDAPIKNAQTTPDGEHPAPPTVYRIEIDRGDDPDGR
jgi:hypothetical protein